MTMFTSEHDSEAPTSSLSAKNDDLLKCAQEIAAVHPTPFYLYLRQRAREALRALLSGLHHWGVADVAYSVKTNPFNALLRDLANWGVLAEVASTWELAQAKAAGFSLERIVVNGPLKSNADCEQLVLEPPRVVNIDSMDELGAIEYAARVRGVRIAVGLRLCPPKFDDTWSRFGLQEESGEFAEAIEFCRLSPALQLRCLHVHLGTQLADINRYTTTVQALRSLWVRYHLEPEVFLDIGGGFPYDHALDLSRQPFDPAAFFARLADAWGDTWRPRLTIEPGRFIAAPAMAVVSEVLSRKPRIGEPMIIVLNSGTNHNVMAAFYEHAWLHEMAGPSALHRFCGALCMEDDVLSGQRYGPIPSRGDIVVVMNAGAYSFSLAREFIQPRPPVFVMGCENE